MSTEMQTSLASMLFPEGRVSLTVQEVAAKLSVDKKHVIKLIERGHLEAVAAKAGGGKAHWRIPVSAYEQFLLTRSSNNRSRSWTQNSSPRFKRVNLASFLAIAALFLASCATRVTQPYQSSFYTKVKFDPYSGGYSVVGKELDMGGFPNVTKAHLQGAFDKHGQGATYQLHVHHAGQTTWRFLDLHLATDAQASLIPVHALRRDRIWGTVQEEVALDLTRDYLDSHKDFGMDIRITGRYGDVVVKVSGPYVVGFLNKFDLERKFKEEPRNSAK